MTTLLVDGDEVLFKAAAAVEHEIRWDEQNHVLFSNEVQAWEVCEQMLGRLKGRFNPTNVILAFGTPPYFRTEIEPSYKAGRSRKPLCYGLLLDKVAAEYEVKTFQGLEADDVLGVLATHPVMAGKCIIVSQDKDMKTLPATVWDGQDLITYTEAEADYFHLFQTLTGDKTDGYPGCPGMGPVKATALLKAAQDTPRHGCDPINYWAKIVAAYVKAELTEAYALKQARLARILRWSDWNNKEKKPILWSPQ